MQEVKRPKKPLICFYAAMILAILVFNCLVAHTGVGKPAPFSYGESSSMNSCTRSE